jgi:hypothetical protein
MREVVLGRQPGDLRIVAGPSDRDALVVHVIRPRPRVLAALADGVVHLVAIGVDCVRRHVADAPPGGAHDLREIACQGLARDDAAGEEDLVRPGAHLHLAVRARVRRVALGDDGVGDLVAELIRVARAAPVVHGFIAAQR